MSFLDLPPEIEIQLEIPDSETLQELSEIEFDVILDNSDFDEMVDILSGIPENEENEELDEIPFV